MSQSHRSEAERESRSVDPELSQLLARNGGRYQVVTGVPGFVVVSQQADTQGDPSLRPRVLMTGEIISSTTIIEIINIIATTGWRGELSIVGTATPSAPAPYRALAFDQGALRHARSNVPEDRLGEVLFAAGVLTRGQLELLLAESSPERRIGQLVVEHGFLRQEQLFDFLVRQISQVFFAALAQLEGTYCFIVADEVTATASTAHLPIQNLLMEGVQRMDEIALFRKRIANDSLCPEAMPDAARKAQDPISVKVLEQSNGKTSIKAIAKQLGFETYHVLRAVYYMLQQGAVTLRTGRSAGEEAAVRLVAQFNAILGDIFLKVADYGGVERTRVTLAAWLHGSGNDGLFGSQVNPDGTVDANKVIVALRKKNLDHPLMTLHHALHELAAFTMFAATTSLPREEEMLLSRDVNRRIMGIRV